MSPRRRPAPRWTCLLLGVLGACVPWYRSDEVRAIEAADEEAIAADMAACEGLLRGNRAGEAATCFEAALERSPRHPRLLEGTARALEAAGRAEEARAVAEEGMRQLEATADPEAARALAALVLDSYAREGLHALAIDRAAERAPIDVVQAAAQYPAVFGALAQAKAAADAGNPSAALERYAAWLSAYGTPDHRLVRSWSDQVLAVCVPLAAPFVERGDREAAAESWIAATVAYGQAFRFLPTADLEGQLLPKLAGAAAHLADPSWLSPTAIEAAQQGSAALAAGQIGKALEGYRRAVAFAPYWPEAHHNLAVLLASVGLYGEAARSVSWFLVLAPTSPLAERARSLRNEWSAKAPAGSTPAAGGTP